MIDAHNRQQKNPEISVFGLFCLILLALSVLGTALGVIVTTFENRHYLAELESLRVEARDMQVLWGQYLVEKSTWANYSRVQDIAVNMLEMQTPAPDKIIVVKVQ